MLRLMCYILFSYLLYLSPGIGAQCSEMKPKQQVLQWPWVCSLNCSLTWTLTRLPALASFLAVLVLPLVSSLASRAWEFPLTVPPKYCLPESSYRLAQCSGHLRLINQVQCMGRKVSRDRVPRTAVMRNSDPNPLFEGHRDGFSSEHSFLVTFKNNGLFLSICVSLIRGRLFKMRLGMTRWV